MGDRPLFWKEQHGDRGLETELVFNISILSLVLAAIAGLMTVAMGVIELLSSGTWDPESFAIVEMIATPGLIVVAALAVGFGTALSVIAERERGTLTVLLTIPEPRSAILSAKLNGNLWRVRYFAATLVVLWLFGLILGVVGPLEFLGRVLMTAALLDAIGRIGMSISVGTRNASAALLALMVVYVLGGIAVIWCVVALGITGLYISAAAVWLVGRLGWRGAVDAFEREEPS